MKTRGKIFKMGLALLSLCSFLFASEKSESSFLTYKSDVFYVGGKYVAQADGKELMHGQMYVEKLTPNKVTHKYPLVLIHGAAQTAVNWMTTPDGRKGWATYFLEQGYEVYMIDQPGRGRSAWHPQDGDLRNFHRAIIEKMFTAPEQFKNQWPQAYSHTQWPGTGKKGDPVFDQFYASQVESIKSHVTSSTMVRDAGAALLDKIGPAIILTHSQSGPFGWLIADVKPKLVKGIVTIEPSGPPIENTKGKKHMPWGVTEIDITYSPSISSPTELIVEKQKQADGKNLAQCWVQKEPAKQLVNLKGIPILFITTEASYHAPYDHCTSKWLTQAGVKNDYVRLENVGIKGNGHMLMLEKNNLDISRFINTWLKNNI